jgi:formylglycine-generating enzyme required for sulfatase activity
MKWYVGWVLGLSLILGASVSQGEWQMRVHRGQASAPFNLTEIDSLSFHDTPPGMAWIPPGDVRLGQVGIAVPVHTFYVHGFYVDRCEVSNAKYKAFIDAGGYQDAAHWNPVGWAWRVANSITLPLHWDDPAHHGGGIAGNDQFPVIGVSWWEADAYCRWAGGHLPTEAEWEKAAKGGCETRDPAQCDGTDTPTYPWGELISGARANFQNSGDPYDNGTTPVSYYDGTSHGGYQTIDSPSPYGLYDLLGNVHEWCSSKYADYPYSSNDGREDPPATYNEGERVVRGGDYTDSASDSNGLRCAARRSSSPDFRGGTTFGFRCARSD